MARQKRTNRAVLSLEPLEGRRMLSFTFGTAARFEFNVGTIDVELFNDAGQTPQTVANFLNYVNGNDYDGTLIHHSSPGSFIRGGGFQSNGSPIATNPPVQNEFGAARSNLRGTLAMAKDGGPDSATSQWFFNIDDNSATFDTENGGSTVFGQIIGRGRRIADLVSVQPTFSELGFSQLPRLDTDNNGTSDTHVIVNSISQIELVTVVLGTGHEQNLSFTDADESLVTVGYGGQGIVMLKLTGSGLQANTDGTSLNLTGAAIQISEITVNGLANGTTVVVNASGGDGQATVGALNFAIGATGLPRSLTYLDGDGTQSTISLSRAGTANIRVSGSNLAFTVARNSVAVAGVNVAADEISLTGTNATSTLLINSRGGDGATAIGGIFADSPIGSINARFADVSAGLVSLQGMATNLNLRLLSNARVAIGAPAVFGQGVAINVAAASDTALVSQMGVRSLRAAQWTNTDDGRESFTAPWIGTMNIVGDFSADLEVAGVGPLTAIANLRIGGVANGQSWQVNGNSRVINVGQFSQEWEGQFNGIVSNIRVGTMSGSLTALAVQAATFTQMLNADLIVTAPFVPAAVGLGRLNVIGTITNAAIHITGNAGVISARSMNNVELLVGIGSLGGNILPTQLSHFASPARLQAVLLRGGPGVTSFVNTAIAAFSIGTLNLGTVQLENSGLDQGVAAGVITSLSMTGLLTGQPNQVIRLVRLDDPAEAATLIGIRGYMLGDFDIRLF